MRRTMLAVVAAGVGMASIAVAQPVSAASAPGALAIGKPADAGGGIVQDVRWRGRGVGLGLALGLGLGFALAPRYSYAGSYYQPRYSYSDSYYYDAPRRRCWYSYRYGGWVCPRYW